MKSDRGRRERRLAEIGYSLNKQESNTVNGSYGEHDGVSKDWLQLRGDGD